MRTRIPSLLFSALLSQTIAAREWPPKYAPPAEIKITEEVDLLHRYSSPGFQILSAKALPRQLLTQFVRTAEAVPGVLEALPLPLHAPLKSGKPEIEITLGDDGYLRAGGASGTAGYYNARRGRVIIRWEHFQTPTGPGQLIPAADFDLLVHELSHLGMHRYLRVGPPWLSEGVAEYLASAHSTGGQFDFTRLDRAIPAHLAKRSPPGARDIEVLGLADLLTLGSRTWHEMAADADPFTTLRAYKSALLLTHYYFHGGRERRDEMEVYLGKLLKFIHRRQEIPVLVPAAEIAGIQAKLTRYWAARGLRLDWK